jgi:transposase-like protein
MKKKLREEAIRLRKEERLSYAEIKERLDVAKSTLSYWLRDFPLSEKEIKKRQRQGWENAKAGRERYRNTMRKKKEAQAIEIYIKEKEHMEELPESAFYTAGLMLYHAEGSKTQNHRIKLANTDWRVLRFFIAWLDKFLDIPKEDIRAELHLYDDMDISAEITFWQNKLELEKSQFYKPQVREVRENSFTYSQSHRHGTCGLYYGSVEKKTQFMQAIKAFLEIAGEKM